MKRALRPHQEQGFSKFKDSDSAAFLMEMRLGKTLLTIRWMQHRTVGTRLPRILVVAPTTPLVSWMDELDLEEVRWTHLTGPAPHRASLLSQEGGWFLITYQSLLKTPEVLKQRWDGVILDESTAIKSPRASITKLCVRKLSKITRCRAILTGEVEPEGLVNVWTQMAFIHGGHWMGASDYWSWLQRNFYKAFHEWKPREGRKEAIKKAVHDEAFCLTKKEAGLEPTWKRSRHPGTMCDYVRQIYDQAVDEWVIPGLETKHAFVTVTWLRRMVGGHLPTGIVPSWKYDALMDLLDNDEQAVVWFQFKAELKRAWEMAKARGWSVTYLNGDVSVKDRRTRVLNFRKGHRRLFFAIARCGRYGLDLSTASTAIYFSSPYSYEDRKQSEERIATVSRKQELRIVDMVTLDTIDEDVLEAVHDKRCNAEWFTTKFKSKHEVDNKEEASPKRGGSPKAGAWKLQTIRQPRLRADG